MARFTTDCQVAGQPEIAFDVDLAGVPQAAAEHLVTTIEEMIVAGTVIGEGHVIQLGWTPLRVVGEQDGSLALHEPDGSSVPMAFRRGIGATIRQMLLQQWHADSYVLGRASGPVPGMRTTAIACTRLGEVPGMRLSRSVPEDASDSGWFIGCSAQGHDHEDAANLIRTSLYEVFIRVPRIAAWVAFPPNSVIELEPGAPPLVRVAGRACPLIAGSYVEYTLKSD